jgi:hypothetical protein
VPRHAVPAHSSCGRRACAGLVRLGGGHGPECSKGQRTSQPWRHSGRAREPARVTLMPLFSLVTGAAVRKRLKDCSAPVPEIACGSRSVAAAAAARATLLPTGLRAEYCRCLRSRA